MTDSVWSDERGDAALRKADALARREAGESRQAAELIKQFVADAVAAGISPEPLSARSYDGNSRYRTNLVGWYLKQNHSVAVDADGLFYVLTAPPRFMSRFTGTTVEPSPPPLELGKGGRDGESMPIATALAKRLAGGNDW
ncbi:hypothetical protein [Demequina aurantiaca]|uniref:hypothetical protein n=1 Tax=Demequina aurantiaca TaxID=676200 RepID=UPI00078540CB|nr:hypothetical protein [Demequina aurantiaca]